MNPTANPTATSSQASRLRNAGRVLAATAFAAGLLLGAACGDDEPDETTVGNETPVAATVAEGPSIFDVANPADKGSSAPDAAARATADRYIGQAAAATAVTSIYEVANPADKGSRPADGETRPTSGPF